jgi:hypothetical protein
MKKPLIGITAPPGTLEVLLQKSYMRAYIAAVEKAGGEAKLIPIEENPLDPSALMQGINGLLLSGGGDVDPARYNGASLLGLNGTVVKSHGGANELAFQNAIGEAVLEVKNNVIDLVRNQINDFINQGLLL